ncbi:MAG: hypothetical protein EOP84_27780 [Verrucomicrobiaceae bacterium]|nr:MAG: hypothetical protein EOP84_27780 [Verrucomicrobiaceae bacterium]
MEEVVRRWRPKGAVYFWFEVDKRQGDGWHLAADAIACADLEELVALAKASPFPARFTLPLRHVAGASGDAPAELLVCYDARWPPEHWRIIRNGRTVLWELGSTKLGELQGAAGDLRRGEVDYVLGGEEADQRVWSWWPPER